MSLDRSNDIALNAAHTHTQCQQLHGKGLSGATGTEQVQIGIFIFLRVKQIDNAQRVVMAVNSEQHAGIVRHLEGCEHIGRGRTAGQHIPLGFLFKLRGYLQKRHHRAQGVLLLKAAVADIHIHRLEHIGHLLFTPHQFLVGPCGHGHEHRHIKKVLVVIGDSLLDKISCLNGTGKLLIVGRGVLHTFKLRAVQADALGNLVDGLAAVFPF